MTDTLVMSAAGLKKKKYLGLKMPSPEFNLSRLRDGKSTGLLSRIERKGRVDVDQVLVNELGKPEDKPFAFGVVTIKAGKKFAGIGALPPAIADGLDEFTRREFQREKSFWYHPLALVKDFPKPIPMTKPVPGRRFASDVDVRDDRAEPVVTQKWEGMPDPFVDDDGRPKQIKDYSQFEVPMEKFVAVVPGASSPFRAARLESKDAESAVDESGELGALRGLEEVLLAQRVGVNDKDLPVYKVLGTVLTADDSSEVARAVEAADPVKLKEMKTAEVQAAAETLRLFHRAEFEGKPTTVVDSISREDVLNAYVFIVRELRGRGEKVEPKREIDSEAMDLEPDLFKEVCGPEVAKQNDPLQDLPPKPGKRNAVIQAHARGKTVHLDFRIAVRDYLVGWTFPAQIEGAIKEPITTVDQLKAITKNYDVETGNKFLKPMLAPKGLFATPKSRQPLVGLKVEDRVFPTGTDGATKEFPGVITVIDRPKVEYGRQSPRFHEYFITDSKLKNGLWFVRMLVGQEDEGPDTEAGRVTPAGEIFWKSSISKQFMPSILKPRTVKRKVMPPDGWSWIPRSLERDVPAEFRYWTKKGAEARKTRDALVEEGIFTERSVGLVDGEFRLVRTKQYVVNDGASVGVVEKQPKRGAVPVQDSVQFWDPDEKRPDMDRTDLRPLADFAPMKPRDEFFDPNKLINDLATPEIVKAGLDVEPMLNGLRTIAQVDGRGQTFIYFENSREDRSKILPGVAAEVKALGKKIGPFILDTVLVDFDEEGNAQPRRTLSRFTGRVKPQDDSHVKLKAFRLVFGLGQNWTANPRSEARPALEDFFEKVGNLKHLEVLPFKTVESIENIPSLIKWASGQPGGEGAIFKRHESTYTLGRFTSSWSNLKIARPVRAIVVEMIPKRPGPGQKTPAKTFVYRCAVGPIPKKDLDDFVALVKILEEWYTEIGKTFTTNVQARVGQTLEVQATEFLVDLSDPKKKTVHWFTPVVTAKVDERPNTFDEVVGVVFEHEVKRPVEKLFKGFSRLLKAAKEEDEERIVVGVVSEPKTDSQEDLAPKSEIRDAAFKYMEFYRGTGLMHRERLLGGQVRICESWVQRGDTNINGEPVLDGTWLMTWRIVADSLWKDVKAGRLTGFSIQGSAIRDPVR